MRLKIAAILALLATFSPAAFANTTYIKSDTVKVGLPASGANKAIEFNLGLGSANPKLRANASTDSLEFANDGQNFIAIGSGSGGGSGYNAISTNSDFEASTAGWTNSGGTFSAVSSGSNLLFDKGSVTFQASASGQYFESAAYAIPVGLQGKACEVKVYQLGGDSNLTLEAVDGGGAVIAGSDLVLQAQSLVTPVYKIFQCPSSGYFKLRVTSTGSSALSAFDRAHLGEPDTEQVAQAKLVGSINWAGTTSCLWSSTSNATFSNFSAISSCPTPTTSGSISVNNSSPNATPSWQMPSMGPGVYYFVATGAFYDDSSAGFCSWRITDGTNSTSPATIGNQGAGTVSGQITYSTTASRTFNIQATGADASHQCSLYANSTTRPLHVDVYYYPSTSQTAYRADQTPASWSGYQTASSGWSVTSTTYADFSAGSGISTVKTTNRNISCATNASNLAAIDCSVPRPGLYHVCAIPSVGNSTANGISTRLVDGSGVVIDPGHSFPIPSGLTGSPISIPLCGDYLASGTSATFKVQGASNAGTLSITAPYVAGSAEIQWEVIELDAPLAMPFVLNQVNSNDTNGERIERVTFAESTACTSSPCTIARQSGSWVTSVTRTGTGAYTINIASGMFSAPPTCTVTSDAYVTAISSTANTASAVNIQSWNSSFASTDYSNYNVICMGPK